MGNAIAKLKERVEESYTKLNEKWLEMSKEELIGKAAEIAAVKAVHTELERLVSEYDAEQLLRYDDPLSVVSDLYAMGAPEDEPDFRNDYRRVISKLRSLTENDISELGYAMAV